MQPTLTETQRQAIARADAMMAPAMRLYEERNKILHVVCRLSLADVQRISHILGSLSDEELRSVAAYAEGLAHWNGR